MKAILLLILMSSCITERPKVVTNQVKTVQERIMDCFSYVKTLGANDKFAGDFCTKIYEVK